MRLYRPIVLAAAIAGLCSCGEGDAERQPGGPFESVQELRAAVIDAGVDCPSEDIVPGISFDAEEVHCGDAVSIQVYSDSAETIAAMHDYLSIDFVTATPFEILIGENWIVVDANIAVRESKIPALESAIGGVPDRNYAGNALLNN